MSMHYGLRHAVGVALFSLAATAAAQTAPPPGGGPGMAADAPATAPSSGGLPAAQEADGVRYVTGGFGLEQSEAFKSAMSDYAIGMVFSESSGAYLSNIAVEIQAKGDGPTVNIADVGPYLLVDVPDGAYTVTATYEGKSQTRDVNVSGGSSGRLGFSW